jgi:Protein of unknown function (DUF2911)
MHYKKAHGWIECLLLTGVLAMPLMAQGLRGKAELKAGTGPITIEYGRPSLKGRDMIGQLKTGDVWRMGQDDPTVLTTPVDLIFGNTKIPKGSYRLQLGKVAEDKYELIFQPQSGQSGASQDLKVPLKKESVSSPVETFTIELKEGSKGGTFVTSWGTLKLSADFQLK